MIMNRLTSEDVKEIKVGDKFIFYPRYLEKREYYATVKEICTNHIVMEIKAVEKGFFGDPRPYNISIRKLNIGIDEELAYA